MLASSTSNPAVRVSALELLRWATPRPDVLRDAPLPVGHPRLVERPAEPVVERCHRPGQVGGEDQLAARA